MKNSEGGFVRFLSGRGFYAALAVCLVGAAAAAWVTVDKSLNQSQNSAPEHSEVSRADGEKAYSSGSVFDAAEADVPKKDAPILPQKPAESSSKAEETFNFVKKQKFSLPTDGNIIRGHSAGELIKYDSLNEWRTHDGIDIEAAAGTEIKAAADGTVSEIKNDPLWGWTVELEHEGGFLSIYCGLEQPTLEKGARLASGDVIGRLGETNLAEVSDGSHLHFAIKQDGKFIDPMEKLGIK